MSRQRPTIIPSNMQSRPAHVRRGQIPAQFKLLPFDSPYASKFSFRPREGTLDVGEVKTIRVQLQSDLLGTFSDTFSWSLNGSSEALKLQFKGSIVGPKFKVSPIATTVDLYTFANNLYMLCQLQHWFCIVVVLTSYSGMATGCYCCIPSLLLHIWLCYHRLMSAAQLSSVACLSYAA